MSFDAKTAILSAIAKTDDPNMKTVLLLLLGVLEEIGSKIDSFASNDDALRQAVLNGHEGVHHAHHEWIEKQIKAEADQTQSSRKIRDDVLAKVLGWCAVGLLGFIAGTIGIFK